MDKKGISICILNSLADDGIISPLLVDSNREFLIKSIEKGIENYEKITDDLSKDAFAITEEDYYRSAYLNILKMSLSDVYKQYYDNLEELKRDVFFSSVNNHKSKGEIPSWYSDFSDINLTPPSFEERINNLTLSEYNESALVNCFYKILEKDGYLHKYIDVFDTNEDLIRQSKFLNADAVVGHFISLYGNADDAKTSLEFMLVSEVPETLESLYQQSLSVINGVIISKNNTQGDFER